MAAIDELLSLLKERGGSDLHLAAGIEPRMRAKGELAAIEGRSVYTDESLRTVLREIATHEQWASYEGCGDLDFAYGLQGVARFRANYLVQENGAAAVFRIIPEEILSLEKLSLPPSIEGLAIWKKGSCWSPGPPDPVSRRRSRRSSITSTRSTRSTS